AEQALIPGHPDGNSGGKVEQSTITGIAHALASQGDVDDAIGLILRTPVEMQRDESFAGMLAAAFPNRETEAATLAQHFHLIRGAEDNKAIAGRVKKALDPKTPASEVKAIVEEVRRSPP